MSTRRQLLQHLAVAGAVAGRPIDGRAQPARVRRVGVLMAEAEADQRERLEALRAGLRDHDWAEGRNLSLEIRSASGRYEQLPRLASELVASRVELIVAFGIKALVAAHAASSTVPLVIPATSSDLVALGLIRSLARPGGHITGSTTFGSEVMAERIELLRDAVPRIARVGILHNPANAGLAAAKPRMTAAAGALGIALTVYPATAAGEFERQFEAMGRDRIEGLVVQDDTLFAAHATTLARLALRRRLAMIGDRPLAAAGALMGYGRDELALYRRGAQFVSRILNGASPADLPIEQAMRLELILHQGTARALGLTLPSALTLRADDTLR